MISGRSVPAWKKFLAHPANKAALAVFLSQYVCEHAGQHLQPHQKLNLAGGFQNGETTKCVTSQSTQHVAELFCTHEEADTRMLLHVNHADTEFRARNLEGTVVVESPDTDVLVLLVYFFDRIPSVKTVYFKISVYFDRRRYIPVHEICSSFASVFTPILPAVHALTGCDSVSSLSGIGKKKMIKIIQDKGAMSYEDLQYVGVRNLQSVEKASERFVCDLYGAKGNREYDINKLRAIHAKLKSASLARLPPCRETLKQHVLRADWQTRIWLCSTTAKPDIPSPGCHGWSQEADGGIVPHLFDGGTASEVMEELLCACSGRFGFIGV